MKKYEENTDSDMKVTEGETNAEVTASIDNASADFREAIKKQAREDEQPQSNKFTLRKVLGGDILTATLIRKQIYLILLIVFFVIVYITNRYNVQKQLIEIDALNKELNDIKYKSLSVNSMLTEKCRESHVLDVLKNSKDSTLKVSSQPPFIITVESK
ncbi:MAG: FtsL-like putative cell division protein [Prevotella sp.]